MVKLDVGVFGITFGCMYFFNPDEALLSLRAIEGSEASDSEGS